MDGNFSFHEGPVFREGQLYVIRAPLRDTSHACLTGKSQAEYEELLEAVLTALRRS